MSVSDKIRRKLQCDILRHRFHYKFWDLRKPRYCVIVPFDEVMSAYGLADRLRHSLSVYLYCKRNGFDFKILHNKPFELSEALSPNLYDWLIPESDFSLSPWHTKSVGLWSYYKKRGISEEDEAALQLRIMRDSIKRRDCQYQVYGNAHTESEHWAQAFSELFKPSPKVDERLQAISLPEEYEAVTLRFQQLLGDFPETCFKPLSPREQDLLIDRCIERIEALREDGKLSSERLLVTSDSRRFLDSAASRLPYVRTIPGEMAHLSNGNQPLEVYLKSFVDLFALSRASRVTLLKTGEMYLSGFPEFAAILGGHEFVTNIF